MKRKDLEQLVQGMADETLSAEEFAGLQDELRTNADSRAFFRESMEVELLLAEAIYKRVPGVVSKGGMESFLRRRQRRNLTTALLAAAAVLVMSGLALHQIFVKSPDPGGHLAFTPGTVWTGNGVEGGVLMPGQVLKVEFGVAELKLPSGVHAIIEGPAELMISVPLELDLIKGRGWFRVEKEGRGFTVRTPQIEVRDLGTEFGVITRTNELDEVHVFEGEVELKARFALKKSRTLLAGSAAKVSPVGRWIDQEPDENLFLRELPPALPGIRFTFDGENPLRPDGDHPAVAEMAVGTRGDRAPNLVDGVRGRALRISEIGDVLRTDWPGIGGDEARTIACWIRCAEDLSGWPGIVSWGDPTAHRSARCKLLVEKSKRRQGKQVIFFSLGDNAYFSGSTPLQAGEWHHVAMVFRGAHDWSGDMVELYVDGRREKEDSSFTHPPKDDQEIRTVIDGPRSMPLQIGTGPYADGDNPFLGDIDEVWILPRALSSGEVRGLMEQSLPNPK